MTDGEENSSREWKLNAIRELIKTKEAAGNWTFVFLGANVDAFEQGANLGVPMAQSVRYDPANYRASTPTWRAARTHSQPPQSRQPSISSKEKLQGSRSPEGLGR